MLHPQELFFYAISFPVELLLEHCSHKLSFWLTVAAAYWLVSRSAAALVLLGALFTLLASYSRKPGRLPSYRGKLDVFFGRSYHVSIVSKKLPANNNVTIAAYKGKLIVAYRNAETHFASPSAALVVAEASGENLEDWTEVWRYQTGNDDLREMLMFEMSGRLFCYFACLAPNKKGFAPRGMHWTSTTDLKVWSDPVDVGRPTEIIWDVKVREEAGREVAYKASYVGNHYAGDAICTVLFERSTDAMSWQPVSGDGTVYTGGVSEVSFAFTPSGNLVAIGRNEDGDASGFGTQLFFASAGDLGKWTPLATSSPYRFDSPRLLCMNGELLLFARYAREPYDALPHWMSFGFRRCFNLFLYSALSKSGAVYRLKTPDGGAGKGKDLRWPDDPLEVVRCFEDTFGDTGFFSIASVDGGETDWVVANYASSACHSHAPWIYGQVFPSEVRVCRCRVQVSK